MAPKGKPQTKPTAKKPTTPKTGKATASKQTKKRNASKSARKGRASSLPSSRVEPDQASSGTPPHRGRPKDSADVWTPEYRAELADKLWAYIEATACPTEAEFCIKYLVHPRRMSDIEELKELMPYLFAKRQAYTIRSGLTLKTGEGPRGAFLAKLAANAGQFSLVEKLETENRTTSVNEYALPSNGREKGRG